MKKILIALTALILLFSAALAEDPIWGYNFHDNLNYKAELIKVECDSLVLKIPYKIQYNGADYTLRSIESDAFEDCDALKYVHLMHNDQKNFVGQIANGALDFSSAANLETIYLNFDITDEVRAKFIFAPGSNVDILKYVDISRESINIESVEYADGAVAIRFNAVDGASGYMINREGSDGQISFDSNASEDNGIMCFTDETAVPGASYDYTVIAYHRLGNSIISNTCSITIPNPGEAGAGAPIPETGDSANLILWTALLAMSMVGMIYLRKAKKI